MVFEITQLPLMNEGILSTTGLTAASAASGNQLQLVGCLECNPCAARRLAKVMLVEMLSVP